MNFTSSLYKKALGNKHYLNVFQGKNLWNWLTAKYTEFLAFTLQTGRYLGTGSTPCLRGRAWSLAASTSPSPHFSSRDQANASKCGSGDTDIAIENSDELKHTLAHMALPVFNALILYLYGRNIPVN